MKKIITTILLLSLPFALGYAFDLYTKSVRLGVNISVPNPTAAGQFPVSNSNNQWTASSSPTVNATTTFAGNVGFKIASTTGSLAHTINWQNGTIQKIILQGATTIAINATSSSPADGGRYILDICQGGAGSHAVTFTTPGQLRWTSGTTSPATAVGTCTWIGFIYDASTQRYTAIASTTVTNN